MENRQNGEFKQEVAWGVFEQFASGDFNEVANYQFHDVQDFYAGSLDFVRAVVGYRKALEKEFDVKLK